MSANVKKATKSPARPVIARTKSGRIDHSQHDHPATAAARAVCRKSIADSGFPYAVETDAQ